MMEYNRIQAETIKVKKNNEQKKMKPNRQELKIIFVLIFKVIIPMKWRMFKQRIKDKFKRKVVIIK